MLYSLHDKSVAKASCAYVAPGAHVIGDVELQQQSSVWFNAVLRGDCEKITLGQKSNVQDGAVLHCDPGYPLVIGEGVTIGHRATLHGCCIGDYSLVGINAVVLNGAKIGKHCIVGANALVKEHMEIPDRSVVMGTPAKIVKQLTLVQVKQLELSAQHYTQNAARYQVGLQQVVS